MPSVRRAIMLSSILSYSSGQDLRDEVGLLQVNAAKHVGHKVQPAQDLQWTGTLPEDLIDEFINHFYDIFPTGNRNAASHKWAGFLFNHTASLPIASFDAMQHSYCAVSGSPVGPVDGADGNAYRVTLKTVAGDDVTGLVRHCCWPCLCDLQDLVRVDTQDVTTADGTHQRKFLVINDPCTRSDCLSAPFQVSDGVSTLAETAPELTCSGSSLVDAVRSNSGKVIIGPFIEDDGRVAQEALGFEEACVARAADGFNSGMGQIFRVAAQCAPF